MMKTLRPWLLVSLLIALLAACSSNPAPESKLESLASPLLGINGKKLIDPTQGNCPVDEFRVPGERMRVRGTAGGIAVLNASYPGIPTARAYPTGTANYVKNTAALYGTPSRNVALLVVDDFGAGVYKLEQAVYDLQTLSFPTSDALSRAIAIETKLDILQALGKLSHGALVMNHINALLVSGGYSVANTSLTGDSVLFKNPSTGTYVLVKAVNTEGFGTSIIAPRLETAFSEVRTLGYTSVAINISFAIVPCSVRTDFANNRTLYPTFESYAQKIAGINGVPLDTVFRTIRRPIIPDPLYTLIKNQQPSGETRVYVAASGNYGLDYPLYPAAWPEVISVSSNDVGAGRSDFSNRGEIMMTGAWFRLTNPASLNGSFGGAPQVVYAGTSFSAPALSVFTAYDLAIATPRCALQMARPTYPDLAYGTWGNKRLRPATTLFCPR
jgi:Subtilase family